MNDLEEQISEVKKKIQELQGRLLHLEYLKSREDISSSCMSESSLFVCEYCDCWKSKRIYDNELK
jgi:hypothetical protein